MACACKCCCGCCCDGSTGSQSLETTCESPKVFKGKGTHCDVCCDLGEIRSDITTEAECPGTWVVNGRCTESPCGGGGCCCINGSIDESYTSRSSCEDCTTTINCSEGMFMEDWEAPCPSGWDGGSGYCFRVTNPESCDTCAGYCYQQQAGPCGKWVAGDCQTADQCVQGEFYCDCQCKPLPPSLCFTLSGVATNCRGQTCPWVRAGSISCDNLYVDPSGRAHIWEGVIPATDADEKGDGVTVCWPRVPYPSVSCDDTDPNWRTSFGAGLIAFAKVTCECGQLTSAKYDGYLVNAGTRFSETTCDGTISECAS